MIKLVVLDFDDTLALTEEACFYLENLVAGEMGFAPMSRQTHQANWGVPLEKAIIVRFPGIDAAEYMKRSNIKIAELIKLDKFDTVPQANLATLDRIIAKGIVIGILTSRTFGEAKHLLATDHPLAKRIGYFHYKESSQYLKPDPRVFTDILAHYRVKSEETVYVGDSVSDSLCANFAGIHNIISMESGVRQKSDFDKVFVDCFIDQFTGLDVAVDQINGIEKQLLETSGSPAGEEYLIETDAADNVIGPVPRKICHNRTRRPWHRSTHAYLFDKEGRLLLTQRSASKDTAPLCWTISAGGHVTWGSDYERTVINEAQEELGLTITDLELSEIIHIDYDTESSEREHLAIFMGIVSGTPRINREEVEQIKAFDLKDIITRFTSGEFDLSGGSRDSFKHIIANGTLQKYYDRHFPG
jgi:isopentenyl-diphosphate Delta-isomerase